MEKQIKSKKRVADHGEVFTAEREVNALQDVQLGDISAAERFYFEYLIHHNPK